MRYYRKYWINPQFSNYTFFEDQDASREHPSTQRTKRHLLDHPLCVTNRHRAPVHWGLLRAGDARRTELWLVSREVPFCLNYCWIWPRRFIRSRTEETLSRDHHYDLRSSVVFLKTKYKFLYHFHGYHFNQLQ